MAPLWDGNASRLTRMIRHRMTTSHSNSSKYVHWSACALTRDHCVHFSSKFRVFKNEYLSQEKIIEVKSLIKDYEKVLDETKIDLQVSFLF